MRNAVFTFLVLLRLVVPTVQLLAADERCGDAADKALFASESWSDLGKWFERYGECDDGYFAEHISSLVGEWLSGPPEQLAMLAAVVESYPAFDKHVTQHVDTTLNPDTTAQIRYNAERRCPSVASSVCLSVVRALDELDAEVRRLRYRKDR